MRKGVACLIVLALLPACAAQSKYERKHAHPGEIVWAYDGHLQVMKDGRLVAEPASWDGLSRAVECVPDAKEFAHVAESQGRGGNAMVWTGLSFLFGGLVGGTAMFVSGIAKDPVDSSLLFGGFGVLLGGLTVGSVFSGVGDNKQVRAQAAAIDAVNVYNVKFRRTQECRGKMPDPPPSPDSKQ